MPSGETGLGDTGSAGPVGTEGTEAGRAAAQPGARPADFRAGRPEGERLTDLLAFAMAAERGLAAAPETVQRLREEASAQLAGHAFRYLHNAAEQIRRDAVSEYLTRLPKPPGLGKLVLANVIALLIVGLAGSWIALHPAALAGLSRIISD